MNPAYVPVKVVDATEAKNRFGSVARSTSEGPVEISLHGRTEYVLMKASQYRELVELAHPSEGLSIPAAREFERLLAHQGASIIPETDPMEGVTDEALRAALKASLESGGTGR